MLAFILTSTLFACSPDDPRQPSGETVDVDDTGERPPPDDSAPDVDADDDGAPASVDCDDGNPAVNPDADEVCNGIDDDCDGFIDVGAVDAFLLYTDADGDGFGGGAGMPTCDASAGIANGGDCDDANASVNPAACEDPFDGVDDDCSGVGDTQVPVSQTLVGSTSRTDEFQTARDGAVALRVVGSTASRSSDTRVVHFAASQPTVLVLTSDTAVKWDVDETVAGTLERILVVSRDDASASGPKGVPVDVFTGNDRLFDAPRTWGEVTARKMEKALLEETKLEVSSWIFSTEFDELTIDDADAWPEVAFEYPNPICPADATPFGDPDTTAFPGDCQKIIAKGGTVCLTTNADATFLFDLDGESCQVVPAGIDLDMGPSASIGWRGEYVYGCGMDDDYQLIRVRLSDGAVERSYRYCMAVTDWNDQILAQDASTAGFALAMRAFGSWADVVSTDVPAGMPGDIFNQAIATRDDVLYATWFADDEISSFSLTPPYDELPPIALDDYNFYMGGLDVTDDDFIVLKGNMGQRKMLVFDLDGTTVTTFFLPQPSSGVSCFTP